MPDDSAPFIPLPPSVGGREGARRVFDDIADLYDTARPGYPHQLFDDLHAIAGVGSRTSVVEIGCGTGQATVGLAERGWSVRCIEAGPRLADLARRKLARYPKVTVDVGTFEDVNLAPASVDLVFSATAFHWVDPSVGYPKAASLLRPPGHLVLVTNAHVAGGSGEAIGSDIQQLHRKMAPDVGSWTFPTVQQLDQVAGQGGSIAQVWARIERKFADPPDVTHLFEEPLVVTYPWLAGYDTAGYVAMLATQSTYASMEAQRRERLLAEIGNLVEHRLGGAITKQYLAIMAVARQLGE